MQAYALLLLFRCIIKADGVKRITLQHDELKRIKVELELEGTVWRDPETDKTFIIPLCREVDLQTPYILEVDDLHELELLNHAFLVEGDRYFGMRRKSVKAAIGIARSKVEQRVVWDVYRRDGFKCYYCGCDFSILTYDHYVPVSRGGATNTENGRAACKWCNHKKADMLPEEWEDSKTLKQRMDQVKKYKERDAKSI